RNALEQHMSASQEADQQPLDHGALTDDDLFHFGEEWVDAGAHLADGPVDLGGVDGHEAPRSSGRRRDAARATPSPVVLYQGLFPPTTAGRQTSRYATTPRMSRITLPHLP